MESREAHISAIAALDEPTRRRLYASVVGSQHGCVTWRRTGSAHAVGSDDHECVILLSALDNAARFEHGGARTHDGTEGHRASGEDLGMQARVGEALKRDVLVADGGVDQQYHAIRG
jgi:hypothetical protein